MKRAEGNHLMATGVRLRYAAKLFKPEAIAAAIDERSFAGHRYLRVVQDLPFNLSETKAAKALEEWLRREQFQFSWRPAYIEQDPFRPSIVTEYLELTISW
jgi:hypothetical protein